MSKEEVKVSGMQDELQRITEILKELREMRNTHNDEYRSYYNSVCDRLDVLESKLINGL